MAFQLLNKLSSALQASSEAPSASSEALPVQSQDLPTFHDALPATSKPRLLRPSQLSQRPSVLPRSPLRWPIKPSLPLLKQSVPCRMTTNLTNKTIIEKKSANNIGPRRNDKGQGLFAHFPIRMIYIPSLVGLVGQEMVVAPSNSFYINFLALQSISSKSDEKNQSFC